MPETVRYSYFIEVLWKNRTSTNQILTEEDSLGSCVYKLQRNPEVLEIHVHTFETRTKLIKEEVFPSRVKE